MVFRIGVLGWMVRCVMCKLFVCLFVIGVMMLGVFGVGFGFG